MKRKIFSWTMALWSTRCCCCSVFAVLGSSVVSIILQKNSLQLLNTWSRVRKICLICNPAMKWIGFFFVQCVCFDQLACFFLFWSRSYDFKTGLPSSPHCLLVLGSHQSGFTNKTNKHHWFRKTAPGVQTPKCIRIFSNFCFLSFQQLFSYVFQ